MSKINNLKYIAAISVVVMLAVAALTVSCFAFAGCTTQGAQPPTSEDVQQVYDMPEQLTFTAAALAANPSGVSIRISATVTPDSAPNKKVDWSVAWTGTTSSGNVNEYITITPDSDGSTNATITCYKAFSTPIVVKVVTREGGFEATCICSFESLAQSIDVTSSFTKDGEKYLIGTSSSGTFTFSLKNVFGDKANYNLSYEYGVSGSLYLGKLTTNVSAKTYAWSEVSLKSLNEFKDKFITSISFNGDVINISTGINDFKSFRSAGSYDNWGGGKYENMNVAYEALISNSTSTGVSVATEKAYNNAHINDCYIWIKVTDSVSKNSVTLKLYYSDSVVSGVSLSQSTIKI